MRAKFFWSIICLHASLTFALVSEEVVIRTPSGHVLSLEMDPTLPFQEAMRCIESCVSTFDCQYNGIGEESNASSASAKGWFLDFMCGASVTKSSKTIRDYDHEATPKEKSDLRYIVTSLAKSSWMQLLKKKSSLERAGDRIDHLHPLIFLACIFTDEELKGCFHVIKENGGRIWKNFSGGLYNSLKEESEKNNIKQEHIEDFAKRLDLHSNMMIKPIKGENWDAFINVLVQELPRGGNPKRYDQ